MKPEIGKLDSFHDAPTDEIPAWHPVPVFVRSRFNNFTHEELESMRKGLDTWKVCRKNAALVKEIMEEQEARNDHSTDTPVQHS